MDAYDTSETGMFYFDGTNAYMSGTKNDLKNEYWKNRDFIELADSSTSTVGKIYADGSDVFVMGRNTVNSVMKNGFWKNGEFKVYPPDTSYDTGVSSMYYYGIGYHSIKVDNGGVIN